MLLSSISEFRHLIYSGSDVYDPGYYRYVSLGETCLFNNGLVSGQRSLPYGRFWWIAWSVTPV